MNKRIITITRKSVNDFKEIMQRNVMRKVVSNKKILKIPLQSELISQIVFDIEFNKELKMNTNNDN